MTLPLRARIFLTQALVVAAVLAIVTVLTVVEQRRWLLGQHVDRLERTVASLAGRLGSAPTTGPDPQQLATSLGGLLGLRVTLIDAEGRVRGDSEVPTERLPEVENHASRPEVRAALEGRIEHAIRHSRTLDRPFVYAAAPARGLPGVAVVRLAEPAVAISELQRSLILLSCATAALALVLGIPLVLWTAGGQTRRVRELEAVAARLGSGDRGARARERPADEIGRLGRAVNRMAGELRERFEALEREADERERVLAQLSEGVALVDADGRLRHANRSLAAILGAPLPPRPETPLQDFARAPELEELVRDARASHHTVEREIRLWSPEQRVVRAAASRLFGEGDGSVLLVLHDLTEAERLNRVRQDFVANVSHELKTPLTSVRGYAETLLKGGLDDTEHREGFVRIILDQAVRLQNLVQDLLSLAELERPDVRLKLERFDLREAAERQLAAFRDRARAAFLALEVEPGPPALLVADRARVDQVLANLLDNALKYTERGSVRVAVGVAESLAWCEVRDTGCGIAEEHRERIFERFYRVDRARTRAGGGTGLGLSIVKHIVTLHGGRLTLASTPGTGSAFRFELPLSPESIG